MLWLTGREEGLEAASAYNTALLREGRGGTPNGRFEPKEDYYDRV